MFLGKNFSLILTWTIHPKDLFYIYVNQKVLRPIFKMIKLGTFMYLKVSYDQFSKWTNWAPSWVYKISWYFRNMFNEDFIWETDHRKFCDIKQMYSIQIGQVRRSHLFFDEKRCKTEKQFRSFTLLNLVLWFCSYDSFSFLFLKGSCFLASIARFKRDDIEYLCILPVHMCLSASSPTTEYFSAFFFSLMSLLLSS